jgi:hypothetical protein
MDTSFALRQTRCYQQAARLMAKGASLSVGSSELHGHRSLSKLNRDQSIREPAFSRRRHRIGLGHVLAGRPRVHAPGQCPTCGCCSTPVNQ